MIRILLKASNHLYEIVQFVPPNTLNDTIIYAMVRLYNVRLYLRALCQTIEDLATEGPLLPDELRGLSNFEQYKDDLTIQKGIQKLPPKVGVRFQEDLTHQRTGWLLDEKTTEAMLQCVREPYLLLHQGWYQAISIAEYFTQINKLKKLVLAAYPMFYGLGEWETARILIEAKFDLTKGFYIEELLDAHIPQETSLWKREKEFKKGHTLCSTFKLSRTTITCRFYKKEKKKTVSKYWLHDSLAEHREAMKSGINILIGTPRVRLRSLLKPLKI